MNLVGAICLSVVVGLGVACGSSSSGADGAAGATSTGGAAGGLATGGGAAAAGHGGALATGGRGGAAASGGAGGSTPCAPCFLAIIDRIKCDPTPAATCVEQKSQTVNPNGTLTKVQNRCFSDGTKSLQTSTSDASDGGTGSQSIEIQTYKPGGAPCASGTISVTNAPDSATVMEVIKDEAGNVLATLTARAALADGGEVLQTSTVTCTGQATQPLGTCPSSPSSSIVCSTGTCP